MIDELRELYQEVILDHSRKPRNFGPLENHTCMALGQNPLCGDVLTVYLIVNKDNIVQNIAVICVYR